MTIGELIFILSVNVFCICLVGLLFTEIGRSADKEVRIAVIASILAWIGMLTGLFPWLVQNVFIPIMRIKVW